jgi:hypothetical protein
MKNKMTWEFLNTGRNLPLVGPKFFACRSKVPNGWLFKFILFFGYRDSTHSMIFLQDPEYQWEKVTDLKWEFLAGDKSPNWVQKTFRLPVIGGWLVIDIYGASNHFNAALVFLPGTDWDFPEEEITKVKEEV